MSDGRVKNKWNFRKFDLYCNKYNQEKAFVCLFFKKWKNEVIWEDNWNLLRV